MGRSKNIWGPYEPDPCNPILTSSPGDFNERSDWDHLKPRYYNPDSVLQKSGHASYVDLSNGETWMVHLTARPFVPELRCTLGRETAIQRMKWTEDGWLRMEKGGNMAQEFVQESTLPESPASKLPAHDDFDGKTLQIGYYAPRIDPSGFVDLTSRPGWARLRGQESGCSLNQVSLLARKLTSVQARITTKLDFTPLSYQHTAGLILYYDNMNLFTFINISAILWDMRLFPYFRWKTAKKRSSVMPGPLWRMAVKFICVCRSTAENLSSGGLWTGNIIQRSVPALTPVNFLMSIHSLGNLQGLLWELPAVTA